MPLGTDFALFDGDDGSVLLLTERRRSWQIEVADDPAVVFRAIEASLAAGQWVALAADYALGASFEAAVAPALCGRPVLRAWEFAEGQWLDARAVGEFLADQLAALPEYLRPAGIAGLSLGLDAAKHAALVRRICRWIADGDCYQINLTFPLTFEIYGHPLALYAGLRERQPVRYGGYVLSLIHI